MKKLFSGASIFRGIPMGLLFAAAVAASSCAEDPVVSGDELENRFMLGWINKFGIIDESQNWNMATLVEAEVDPASFGDGLTVSVYTGHPAVGGRLIARTSQAGSLKIDVAKGTKMVYVQATDAQGNIHTGSYYPVDGGRLSIRRSASSRAAAPVSYGETVSFAADAAVAEVRGNHDGTYKKYNLNKAKEMNDTRYAWFTRVELENSTIFYVLTLISDQEIRANEVKIESLLADYGITSIGDKTYEREFYGYSSQYEWNLPDKYRKMNFPLIKAGSPAVTFQKLNGVEHSQTKLQKLSDLYQIFGADKPFAEQAEAGTTDVLADFAASHNTNISYTVSGEISLDVVYGATDKHNVIGYYYWQDDENPLNATRYILIDNAQISSNIAMGDGTPLSSNTGLAGYMTLPETITDQPTGISVPNPALDATVLATSYKVPYFTESGGSVVASYTFPEGTHISFFCLPDGVGNEETWHTTTCYAYSAHNAAFGRYAQAASRAEETQTPPSPAVDAVAYSFGGANFIGFEDGTGGADANDIVLAINGNATLYTESPMTVAKASADFNPWIIACEDMGSVDDYDFNDIVLCISHVAGETTATVTPLAAGGTLSAVVYYNGSPISGTAADSEIHKLLSAETRPSGSNPMINTQKFDASTVKSFKITVDKDFAMSTHFKLFSVKVETQGGTKAAIEIHTPTTGMPPQMLCLPGDWQWPTERTDITKAYPAFKAWSYSNSTAWVQKRTPGTTIEWKLNP